MFAIPYSSLNRSYPGDAWNWILTLPLAAVFVGSYYHLLNTTTPKNPKWELFRIRSVGQKAEMKLDQIEQQMQRDIRTAIFDHQMKRLMQPILGKQPSEHTRL